MSKSTHNWPDKFEWIPEEIRFLTVPKCSVFRFEKKNGESKFTFKKIWMKTEKDKRFYIFEIEVSFSLLWNNKFSFNYSILLWLHNNILGDSWQKQSSLLSVPFLYRIKQIIILLFYKVWQFFEVADDGDWRKSKSFYTTNDAETRVFCYIIYFSRQLDSVNSLLDISEKFSHK